MSDLSSERVRLRTAFSHLARDLRHRRWARVIERTVRSLNRHDVSFMSAAVAFYVFLAIPAALTGLISLYGLGFDRTAVEEQIRGLHGLLPEGVVNLLYEQCKAIASAPAPGLGAGLAVSVLLAGWSGRAAMLSLMTALNRAFAADETRGFFTVQAVAFLLAFQAIFFAVGALILVVVISWVLAVLPLGPYQATAATIMQWSALIGLELLLLGTTYRYAPATRTRCSWFTIGATIAAIVWLLASALFSVYIRISAAQTNVYGQLGGIFIFLTWLYLSVYVVLLGAEINSAIALERHLPRGGQSRAER